MLKDFVSENFRIIKKIIDGENFAFTRYGDGERAIMEGRAVVAQEGWKAPCGETLLGKDIRESLNHKEENFIYGISCPCCDRASFDAYRAILGGKDYTFANLFVNANYGATKAFLSTLPEKKVYLIANENARGKSIGLFDIVEGFYVPDDCVNYWQSHGEEIKAWVKERAEKEKDMLFIFAVGPMSEPLISLAYKTNPHNQYIDFGSAIDEFVHGRITRPYMNPYSPYAHARCHLRP